MNQQYAEKCREIFESTQEMQDFILSFRKMEQKEYADLGIVKAEFSPGFLEALRNYKK